jgi:GNAT superfamily N-acetyltransferase
MEPGLRYNTSVMEAIIRNLTKDQLPQAAHIFVDAFNSVGEMWNYETALKRLESWFDPEYYFGAFIEGKMVAIMTTKVDYVTDHKELYVDIFAVSPKHQGKYVGKVFLDKIEKFAIEKGLNTIWLQASTKLPSYDFYLKNGFNATHWIAIYKNLQ